MSRSISHFVRLHLFPVQDLAHCALRQIGQTCMPFRRSMLASVAGEKSGRPQLVGIAEVLRLSARQRHQPRLGLQRDRRFPAGARAIVERSQRAFGHGALDAALDGLMMQPERPTDRKKRRVFPIGQQYPRPLDPVCRFGSRLRDRSQLRCFRISKRQFNRSPPRCHDTYYPAPSWAHVTYIGVGNPDESPAYDNFHGNASFVVRHDSELHIIAAGSRRLAAFKPARGLHRDNAVGLRTGEFIGNPA